MAYLKYILPLLILLTSCVKDEGVVGLPQDNNLVVVNAKITPDSLFKVKVSHSTSALDTMEELADLSCQIKLYEDGVEILNLGEEDVNPYGIYRSNDFRPKAGRSYQLYCNSNRYGMVQSETRIPAPFESDTMLFNVSSMIVSGVDVEHERLRTRAKINIRCNFVDNVSEVNYYAISVYKVDSIYEYGGDNWTVDSSSVRLKTNFLDISSLNFEQNSRKVLLFSDKEFASPEQEIVINVDFTGAHLTDKVYVKLSSVSESYYLYESSFGEYVEGLTTPFSSPYYVYSNVENGFGVFGGASMYVDSLMLDFREK